MRPDVHLIGAELRTDWLILRRRGDYHGFVRGTRSAGCRRWTLDRAAPPGTSVPGVFVAGDGQAESAKRVAAAVGEGSMAVMFVHRHLAEGERYGPGPGGTGKTMGETCLPSELRTLFLFEDLSEEQLDNAVRPRSHRAVRAGTHRRRG